MEHEICHFGDYVIDRTRNTVSSEAGAQQVSPRVMDVLQYLLDHHERVVSTEELLSTFWDGRIVEESTIHRTISQIRSVLSDSAREPRYIRTVSKRGYQAIALVSPPSTDDNLPMLDSLPAGEQVSGQSRTWVGAGVGVAAVMALIGLWLLTGGAEPPRSSETVDTAEHSEQMPQNSVAMLPLLNLSPDSNLGFFADGLADKTLDELVNLNLPVASRTSSFAAAENITDLAEIAWQLKVAYVIEGSIQESGDALRVTTQLIRAADGYHVWSKTYDEAASNQFDAQSLIAANLARIVGAMIDVDLMRRNADRLPIFDGIDPEAVSLFNDAQYQYSLYALGEEGDWEYSVALLHNAAATDPRFAAAHQQVAWAYMQRMDGRLSIAEASQGAHTAIEKALAIEPDSGDSLLQLAQIHINLDLDYAAAEKVIRRGLELHPRGRWWYPLLAAIAFREGRVDDWHRFYATANVFDFGEEQVSFLLGHARGQIANHNPEGALETIEAALNMVGSGAVRASALRLRGRAHIHAGQQNLARASIAQAWRIDGRKAPEPYVALFAATGEEARAQQLLSRVELKPGNAFYAALGHVHLGNVGDALMWLERGILEREEKIVATLRVGSFWDSLRSEPRFEALLGMLRALETNSPQFVQSLE